MMPPTIMVVTSPDDPTEIYPVVVLRDDQFAKIVEAFGVHGAKIARALALLDRIGDVAEEAILKGEAVVVRGRSGYSMRSAAWPFVTQRLADGRDDEMDALLNAAIAAGRLDTKRRGE